MVSPFRRRAQMIFQDPFSSLDPHVPVIESVAEPLLVHFGTERRERLKRAAALFDRVGLSTAPFGATRKGQFWWAGKRVFLDFEDPEQAVVLELKGHSFARIAVQPDTDPEPLAAQIRERLSAGRP